jgi:ABC-type transporter Mla MlaB component
MYKRFLKALDVSNTIEVKASKVKKVDTAGLQIVIAVKRKLDKSGGQVIWSNPSEELVDSARILGFPSIFGLDD